jgi:acyl dehydratase
VLAVSPTSFVNEVVSKRSSESRPGWGVLQGRNTGTNQRGEEVFSLLATAFVPMRGS